MATASAEQWATWRARAERVSRRCQRLLGLRSRKVRVYMDGCFDMMHYGHANALRQAAALGDELVIGLVPDSEIKIHKGPPVFNDGERRMAVEAVKWVDEVITGVPYDVSDEFMAHLFKKHRIDYIVHGDDPCYTADGKDAYASAKRRGKYKEIKRTEGVSTTDIVGRMLMCTRRTSSLDTRAREEQEPSLSPLQKKFVEEEDEEKQREATRVSNFMPTSRRIVQFSSGKKIKAGSRVVYVDGAFDVFHPGHIVLLRDAKARGDFLLVGVWPDEVVAAERGAHFPILNVHERALSVLACRYVDEVVIGAPRHVTRDLISTFNIGLVLCDDLDEVSASSDREAYAVPREMGILVERGSPSGAVAEGGEGGEGNSRGSEDGASNSADSSDSEGGSPSAGAAGAAVAVKQALGVGLEATEARMRPFTLSKLISRIVANRRAFEVKFSKKSKKEADYVKDKSNKTFVQEV
uniref:ethanolamine-phosphate cytidylyltransferase n=1 Tax=Prasinoderma singulare TaxID=676789 RepID=A0A7S3FFP1_9VIRI